MSMTKRQTAGFFGGFKGDLTGWEFWDDLANIFSRCLESKFQV